MVSTLGRSTNLNLLLNLLQKAIILLSLLAHLLIIWGTCLELTEAKSKSKFTISMPEVMKSTQMVKRLTIPHGTKKPVDNQNWLDTEAVARTGMLVLKTTLNLLLHLTVKSRLGQLTKFCAMSECRGLWLNSTVQVVLPHLLIEFQLLLEFMLPKWRLSQFTLVQLSLNTKLQLLMMTIMIHLQHS